MYVSRSARALRCAADTLHMDAAETAGKKAQGQQIIPRQRHYYIFKINPLFSKHRDGHVGWNLAFVNIGIASGDGDNVLQMWP